MSTHTRVCCIIYICRFRIVYSTERESIIVKSNESQTYFEKKK